MSYTYSTYCPWTIHVFSIDVKTWFSVLLCSFVTVQKCSSGRTVSALIPDSHMPQCCTHSPPPLSLLLSEEAHTNLCKVTPNDSAKHQLGTHTHISTHMFTCSISHFVFLSHKHAYFCKCIHAALTTSGLIISLFPSTGLALPPAFPTMVDNHVSHNSSMAYMGAMEPKPVYQPPQVTPSRYSPVPRHMLGEDDFTRSAVHLFSAFTKSVNVSEWNKNTLTSRNHNTPTLCFTRMGICDVLHIILLYHFTWAHILYFSLFI